MESTGPSILHPHQHMVGSITKWYIFWLCMESIWWFLTKLSRKKKKNYTFMQQRIGSRTERCKFWLCMESMWWLSRKLLRKKMFKFLVTLGSFGDQDQLSWKICVIWSSYFADSRWPWLYPNPKLCWDHLVTGNRLSWKFHVIWPSSVVWWYVMSISNDPDSKTSVSSNPSVLLVSNPKLCWDSLVTGNYLSWKFHAI